MAEALPDFPKQTLDTNENSNSTDGDSDFSDDGPTKPLNNSFNEASNHVRKITSKLDNNQLLQLYGLYKQSTEGKCNTPKPSWFDGKGRKKWEAWRVLTDMTREEAMEKYVELIQKLDPDFGNKTQSSPKEFWAAVSSLKPLSEPELVQDQLTILDAARENMGELVTKLLSTNSELKYMKDEDGLTALHWAADRNAICALKVLINCGCDINAVDNLGQTPLHYAASCDHVNSTQILIDAGAHLIKDNDDCTPLDVATNKEVRKILDSAMK